MITKDRTNTRGKIASKSNPAASPDSQRKQAKKPEKDYTALQNRVEELSRQVLQEPDVDNKEKVKRIKAEIQNGTYKVDAEAIAQKLMELEVQIGRKR